MNPPANAGDKRDVGSIPGLGPSLEEGMATHSSVLAWRIPMTEGLIGYCPSGRKESDTTEATLRTRVDLLSACGPSLVQPVEATLCCGVWVSCCGGFSCWGAQILGAWASLVVAQGLSGSTSSWTRDQAHIPCNGRWVLTLCTISKIPLIFFLSNKYAKYFCGFMMLLHAERE